MKKQIHVYYSGRVQGIGFRYTVQDMARQQAVCGWVKNLDNGKVEVVAEAEEDFLKIFLEQVNHNFSRYFSDVNLEWLPASGQFRDFQIAS